MIEIKGIAQLPVTDNAMRAIIEVKRISVLIPIVKLFHHLPNTIVGQIIIKRIHRQIVELIGSIIVTSHREGDICSGKYNMIFNIKNISS